MDETKREAGAEALSDETLEQAAGGVYVLGDKGGVGFVEYSCRVCGGVRFKLIGCSPLLPNCGRYECKDCGALNDIPD